MTWTSTVQSPTGKQGRRYFLKNWVCQLSCYTHWKWATQTEGLYHSNSKIRFKSSVKMDVDSVDGRPLTSTIAGRRRPHWRFLLQAKLMRRLMLRLRLSSCSSDHTDAFYWSASTRLTFSTGRRRPHWRFLLVDGRRQADVFITPLILTSYMRRRISHF